MKFFLILFLSLGSAAAFGFNEADLAREILKENGISPTNVKVNWPEDILSASFIAVVYPPWELFFDYEGKTYNCYLNSGNIRSVRPNVYIVTKKHSQASIDIYDCDNHKTGESFTYQNPKTKKFISVFGFKEDCNERVFDLNARTVTCND